MQVKAKLNSYEELEFAVTLLAPVKEWRAMVRQLRELHKDSQGLQNPCAWPLSGLDAAINQMLFNLDKTHADVLLSPVPESVRSTKPMKVAGPE